MRGYLEALVKGQTVFVNPNSCRINAAGTNMLVEVYFVKDLDSGNKAPTVISYRSIEYLPEDWEMMEGVFNQKKIQLKKFKRAQRRQASLS